MGRYAVNAGLPPRGTGLITGAAGDRRVGQPRTDEERYARHFGLTPQSAEWDWQSFGWGMLAGGAVAVTVGGLLLYVAWPTFIRMLGFETVKAALR